MPTSEPLVRPRGTSVHVARPLFQVLLDDSQRCRCHLHGPTSMCSSDSMTVDAAEYDRPERIFL